MGVVALASMIVLSVAGIVIAGPCAVIGLVFACFGLWLKTGEAAELGGKKLAITAVVINALMVVLVAGLLYEVVVDEMEFRGRQEDIERRRDNFDGPRPVIP